MTIVSSSRARSIWKSLLLALLGGLVVGAVAKVADESSIANRLGANDVFTFLGLWVVLITMLAAWSNSRQIAVLRVVSFLVAMVMAYYGVTWLLFGIFPATYFLGWTVVALVFAPLFALVTWQTRRRGWEAALGAALPIGLLVWEAYSLRWSVLLYGLHVTQFVFDILAAIVLFVVLPATSTQRLRVIPLTLMMFYLAGIGFDRILPVVLGIIQRSLT